MLVLERARKDEPERWRIPDHDEAIVDLSHAYADYETLMHGFMEGLYFDTSLFVYRKKSVIELCFNTESNILARKP